MTKVIERRENISIHASAREATMHELQKRLYAYISIHASAREATTVYPAARRACVNFNPRLREGGDSILLRKTGKDGISIHASAREATI